MAKTCKRCRSTDRFPSGGCRPCGLIHGRASSRAFRARKRVIREGLRELGIVIPRKKRKSKYGSPDERRLEKNRRRCQSRAADPSYRNRANGYNRVYAGRLRSAGVRRIIKRRPLAKKAHRAARRAREQGAPGFHTAEQLRLILAWQQHRCAYCTLSGDLHLDHMIPLIRGGSNWPWNLQWLCPPHNLGKGSMTDAEYRLKLGLSAAQHRSQPFRMLIAHALLI